MSLHLLWTDQCFLFILALSFIGILTGLRKEHHRLALITIFKRPIAVSASIVMALFLIVAVLDSIHFSTGTSCFDRIFAPLDEIYETTYSAPLALTAYSVEMAYVQGHVMQVYPRLNYPPANIINDKQKWSLIMQIIIKGLSISVLTLLSFWMLWCLYKGSFRNFPSAAEWSAFITLFICFFFVITSYWLSRYFHLFGTGKIGEDIFYYAVKSIRTGLVIGTLTTLFMMPLALLLGIAAGYYGGIVDDFIQFLYTTLSSIPGVLLITASVLSMQTYISNHPQKFSTLAENADARLLALCLILGVTSWTSLCRLLRAETLKLREIDYVLAAKSLGASSSRIIYKHLLPNVMHILIITLVLDFSFLVLAEAVLSYVGVGVSPMTISWGNMINAARLELAREPIVWWPMTAAFLFMFALVLATNLLADAIRDVFDPHPC